MTILSQLQEKNYVSKNIPDDIFSSNQEKLTIIANRNNNISFLILIPSTNLEKLYDCLNKKIPNLVKELTQHSIDVLVDIDSIVNDTTKCYFYERHWETDFTNLYPLSNITSPTDPFVGIGFNFKGENLIDYKYYLMTDTNKLIGYRYSISNELIETFTEFSNILSFEDLKTSKLYDIIHSLNFKNNITHIVNRVGIDNFYVSIV